MSIIRPLKIEKIEALGLNNTENVKSSYKFFLEEKRKYDVVADRFPNIYLDKISYEEYSKNINIKYQ